MSESLPTIEVLTSADGALEKDMFCSRCGYNLRGLTLEGLCPECGSPVSRSVHGNLLRFAHPDWINKLRKGITVKLWGMLIGMAAGGITGFTVTIGLPIEFIQIVSFISGLLGLWATFLITTPEPMIGVDEDPVSLRKIIRFSALIGFLGGQIQQFGQYSNIDELIIVVGSTLTTLGIIALFGEFVYLRRFARRIPDEQLASSTTAVMWGFGITMIVIALIAFVFVIMGISLSGGVPFSGAPGTAVTSFLRLGVICFFGICMLVFGIWYLILLFRYRRVFKTARDEAIIL